MKEGSTQGPAEHWCIDVDSEETAAIYEPGSPAGDVVFICAHGAGGRLDDAAIRAAARVLSGRGLAIVRCKGRSGSIKITARGEKLKSGSTSLRLA